MMTIKEFASLCGCNTQTLRYYDKIGLLKPVKVDPWSNYRYYDKQQAIDFVKIKNLQAADFSIGEIKELLPQSDSDICKAFDRKIQQQEQRLTRIREIQQSYLAEKHMMETIIQDMVEFLTSQLTNFEMLPEFGMQPEEGPRVVEQIRAYMEKWLLRSVPAAQDVTLIVNDEVIRGSQNVSEKVQSLAPENLSDTILLGDDTLSQQDGFREEDHEVLWQISGWDRVADFLPKIPKLAEGSEYCFYFLLNREKYANDLCFPMFMLGAMILQRNETQVSMSCSMERSPDEQNHFKLLRRK